MSGDFNEKRDAEPGFDLQRLGQVPTYEVMEPDLKALETAYARESSEFGWFSAQAGIAVTLVTTMAASWASMSDLLRSVFVVGSVVMVMQSARSWQLWRVAKKEPPAVLQRIRTSYRVVK